MRTAICLLTALGLSACMAPGSTEVQYNASRRTLPAADTSNTRYICDVDSLATQRETLIAQARGISQISDDAASSQGLREKMRSFEAEIDAQYRSVVSACRAYIQCMEMNAYKEGECRSSEQRWSQSEERFSNLAIMLRQIEASTPRSREKEHAPKLENRTTPLPDPND